MTFKCTLPGITRDEDSGIELSYRAKFRDGIDTFDYELTDGDIQFQFEVVVSDAAYCHVAKNGTSTKGRYDDAVYILEESLCAGIQKAYAETGRVKPSMADVARYKDVIENAFVSLLTEDGTRLENVPNGTFKVFFVQNIMTLAASYPGLLRCYKLPTQDC